MTEKSRPSLKYITQRLQKVGKSTKTIVLIPNLTEALVGIVNERGVARAVYDKETIIKSLKAEGMDDEDARYFYENSVKKPLKTNGKEPLFLDRLKKVTR